MRDRDSADTEALRPTTLLVSILVSDYKENFEYSIRAGEKQKQKPVSDSAETDGCSAVTNDGEVIIQNSLL